MLKKISAALLAVTVLAAPALAATGKTTEAPAKSTTIKTGMNANAGTGKHHARHYSHHRHHKSVAAIKAKSKVS